MKPISILFENFVGGITNDPRDLTVGVAQMITNFDIFTDSKRAIPYPDVETGDDTASSHQIQAYCVALRTGTTYSLYGLGVDAGHVQVFYKNLTTGAANDLDDDDWNTTANNLTAVGSVSFNCFVYYKKTGRIYGGHLSSDIWKYDPSGGSAFVDADLSISYTNIAQGLVHSQDDILYIPYDNKIAANDNGSWTSAAITLPSDCYITSICEHGAYIAIAAAPLSGVGGSRVYIWDRSSTLATVTENIDWGTGVIKVLESIEGVLIGISLAADSTRLKHRVIFRKYDGYGAKQFRELTTSSVPSLFIAKQKIDNRLHFMMSGVFAGAQREGIWTVGRPNSTSDFAVVHSHTPNNDTALGNGSLKGFYILGDFVFTSYVNNGGSYSMSKTVASATYTKTAIIETVVRNGGDSSFIKKIDGVSATYEPLAAAGQLVTKYKKDEETSFSSAIMTDTTDNSLARSTPTIENGGALPDHKEISFRLESTGGAVPTSFGFQQTPTNSRSY